MNLYPYRRQPYQAVLTQQPPINYSLPRKKYCDPQLTTSSSALDQEDGSGDWDSDPELELVEVRHHQRRDHRLRKDNKNTTVPTQQRKPDNDSPFYSTVVEPSLNLGERWPRPAAKKRFNVVAAGEKPPVRDTASPSKVSTLYRMTIHLVTTYEKQSIGFQYNSQRNPKRILTKPSKAAKNDGFDNEDYDYILRVNDVLGDEKDYQYRVIDILGQGTFGQVVKCEQVSTGKMFSVKVIKNKPAYRTQSQMEVEIIKQLNQKIAPENRHRMLKLLHTFNHKNHFCLVFELLSYNLYELIKQNSFKGLSVDLVRVFSLQLLDTLILLKEAKIIHCDLKPENVLLQSPDSPTIKVIDFGSACHEANRMYTYIQSRFYRSPEVLLGLQYTGSIDMWSLGCIVAELFIGLPLFPGSSEYNQLKRITDMLGTPPQDMLERGRSTRYFYNAESNGDRIIYKMKSREQYGQEQGKTELPGKRYFVQTELSDLILKYNPGSKSKVPRDELEQQRDLQTRHALIDFLKGLLELNPLKRWSPQEARYHPFVTGEIFTEPYKPELHMKLAMTRADTGQRSVASSSDTVVARHELQQPPNAMHSVETATAAAKQWPGHRHAVHARPRAQSMNAPTVPNPMQELANDMQAQAILENDNHEKQSAKEDGDGASHEQRVGWYKHRHARSQGNLIGLLPPEIPIGGQGRSQPQQEPLGSGIDPNESRAMAEQHAMMMSRKVKIAPQVKVRYGMRDAFRMPEDVHGGSDERPRGLATRMVHAGEAAGGLLMMRQDTTPAVTKSGGVAAAIKRRTMMGS
ncbi:dual specificity protein kinase yak1 [Apophysomyces sp. BC1034]|nr:dual specificity protein kinase yak1 [Apophysomyces sp. BC1015]KAG0181112.1 dual specificity protein kinase yak1 [Apophysomyces sp. BC1021]KAG0190792.1 dual specificity protein kinase yak1 [Apophysomyces sp. BC1034]